VSLIAVSRCCSAVALTWALALWPAAVFAQEPTPAPTAVASPGVDVTFAPPVASPEGVWQVAAFDPWGQGLVEPGVENELRVSLLADGELAGETGCGRFSGGWSHDGDELFLGIAPSGNLGCAASQVEEAIGLSTAFDAVAGWGPVEGGGIELFDAAGATRVVLEGLAAFEPTGAWTVQRYRRPNGQLVEPLPGNPMSLTLRADGSVEGSTGCRLLLGAYSAEGGGIVIGPLEPQGRPCEDAARRAERQLLRALGEVVYWKQSGDTLSLNDGFDEPLVELDRTAEPSVMAETGEAVAGE
jgi:heat shock protein HslJ